MRSLIGTIVDKTPVPLASSFNRGMLGGLWNRGDKQQQAMAMGLSGVVFPIVNRTTTACAQVDWHLYRKAPSGIKEERIEVFTHPALTVWSKPNDFTPQSSFVESVQQHVDLTGEGWLVIERIFDRPVGLIYVRPDRMAPVPHPTEFISGYVYSSPDGEKVPLETRDVIFIKMPNPLDPYRGMGPVQTILLEVEGERAAALWNRNFFRNSALPGGVIEVPSAMNDTSFKRLQMQFRENHQGVANSHRVAILEAGAKFASQTYSKRDMEFSAGSQATIDKILLAFGMSKFAVGQVDDVNRATADASDAWFAKWHVVTRLDRWRDALNFSLLPQFGDMGKNYEFDYDNPVPPSIEDENKTRDSKTKAYAILVGAGVDPDDAAETVGLPPMGWDESRMKRQVNREVAA